MATNPVLFICTAEQDIWNGLATLMEPPVARLTKGHWFLAIFWEMAITVQMGFLDLHCPFRQHHVGSEWCHFPTLNIAQKVSYHLSDSKY